MSDHDDPNFPRGLDDDNDNESGSCFGTVVKVILWTIGLGVGFAILAVVALFIMCSGGFR